MIFLKSLKRLLQRMGQGRYVCQFFRPDGVNIFIGAENNLFASTGCSLVIAPYRNNDRSIIGAIGVLGPRHMNYARIIPMVDYTSKAIDRVLGR